MKVRFAIALAVGVALIGAVAGCVTSPGYTICNDLATTCPANTANVIISND